MTEFKAKARIAVAGAGWWSQGWHLPHLATHPDVVLAAIVEPAAAPRSSTGDDLPGPDALGEKYGCPTFASVDALLESGLALDGLLVATPHATHAALGRAALEARRRFPSCGFGFLSTHPTTNLVLPL